MSLHQPHPIADRVPRLAVADLLDILPDAVLMVDRHRRVCYVNPAAHAVLGYTPQELLNQPLSMLVPHDVRERHEQLMDRFRIDGPPTMMGSRPVLHAVHRSGRVVPVSISLTNFTLSDGERVTVAVIHDVTTLNTHLDRATAQAETDALTGLGNRLRLERQAHALLSSGRPFALLFIDLERFKQLNDRLGHEAGDHALRVVARRLRSEVRDADLPVRLGGDEFVVLLDGVDQPGHVTLRASTLAAAIARPLRGDDPGHAVAANIGAAIHPRHGHTLEALLAAADRAMYIAKQGGTACALADVE
jgi:diguanylate cyclase (GGDEF)-like protein/PAS domain S-box-containing protein